MGNQAYGAHNTTNFRESLVRNIIPDEETITFEGLFNQYYFNFQQSNVKIEELVEPSYSFAKLKNWRTGEEERYMTVNLSSSEDGKGYRAPMNCVVVLDISGSMGAYFDADYRDGLFVEGENGMLIPTKKTKMEIAKECLLELSKVMNENENFGVVLFDDKVDVLQPLRKVSDIDRKKLEGLISQIQPRGATDMESAMRAAIEMLEDLEKDQDEKRKKNPSVLYPSNNRIIFLTDAQPNTGGGPNTLCGISKRAAKDKIYTTFIGIGLDFHIKLVEQLTKIRGSNYCSVHSRREFVEILKEDFNYFTTPLVHECHLFLESEGISISACFGTPHGHEGILMNIQTLSASPKDPIKGVKGGVVVIRLKDKLTPKLDPSKELLLTLRFEPETCNKPREKNIAKLEEEESDETKNEKSVRVKVVSVGKKKQYQHRIDLEERMKRFSEDNSFDNLGIRKSVLLVQYCEFMKEILDQCKKRMVNNNSDYNTGFNRNIKRGKYFSEDQIKELKQFRSYFMKEMEIIKDKQLTNELDCIDRMIYAK